jgi:hypothetical protein
MNLKLLNIIGVQDLIDRIGKTIDEIVKNATEKEKLRTELFKLIFGLDMNSDSWLSKNIRPLIVFMVMLNFTLFSFFDGHGIEIKDIYVNTLMKLVLIIIPSYFGLREVGKQLIKRKNKNL